MKNLNSGKSFKKPALWFSVLVVLALAACQSAPAPAAPAAVMEDTAAPAMAEATPLEAVLNVAEDPALGKYLVGADGMALYMFTNDEPNKSNCAGDCLAKWPPLLTLGKPVLGDGVDASLVGSAAMPDGSMIVTYNGMPLYYWVNDKAAGDVTGQNVGGVWFVVSPDGKAVGAPVMDANANDNANSNSNMNDNSNANVNANTNGDDDDDD